MTSFNFAFVENWWNHQTCYIIPPPPPTHKLKQKFNFQWSGQSKIMLWLFVLKYTLKICFEHALLYTTYFYTFLYIFSELKLGRRWVAVLSVQAVPHSTVHTAGDEPTPPPTTTPAYPCTQLTVVSWLADNYPPGFLV